MTKNKLLIKYKVQPFETIEQIAQKFNTNVYSIFDINREVDFNNLFVGQEIYVSPSGNDYYHKPLQHTNTISEIDLMRLLRMLWKQNIYWTRFSVLSMVQNLPDVEQVTARLFRNPSDFAAVMGKFYGNEISERIKVLLARQLNIAIEMVQVSIAGNSQKKLEIERNWYINADEIAEFLAGINLFWSEAQWKKMLNEHLTLTKTEIEFLIAKNYEESITVFDEIETQAIKMSDLMLQGIINQFFKQ